MDIIGSGELEREDIDVDVFYFDVEGNIWWLEFLDYM